MCGFVGFRNTPEVRSPESVVKAMADRIVHRGRVLRWELKREKNFKP